MAYGPTTDVDLPPILMVLTGLCLGVATLDPIGATAVLVAVLLIGWFCVVDHDYITALSGFLALMPVWIFLKWVAWPWVTVMGNQVYLATMLKESFLLVFFCHWLYRTVKHERPRLPIPLSLLGFVGFALLALLQAGIASYPMLARPYIEMFVLVGVPLLGMDLTPQDVDRLLIGTLVGGAVIALVAVYHAFVDPQLLLTTDWLRDAIFKGQQTPGYLNARLQSFTGNPNNLGRMMLLTGIVAFGLIFSPHARENRVQRGAYAGVFLLSTLVLMLSRSRDDIGFFAAGLLLFILLQRRTRPLVFGGIVFGVGVWFNLDQIVFTFERLLTQGNPRFDLWLEGVRFYGWDLLSGIGNVNNQFARSHPYDSTYFRLVVQLGVGGLLLFLLLNIRLLQGLTSMLASGYDHRQATLLVLLCVLLGGYLFSVNLLVFPFSLYYWLVVALVVNALSPIGRAGTWAKSESS